MAISVGAVACTFVKGDLRKLKTRVRSWQVPGLDGYGAQTLGKGDATFTFLVILYGVQSAVRTWYDDIEAVQGTVVTIENDWGAVYTECLVQRVGELRRSPARDGSGGVQVRGETRIEGVQIRE